MEYCITRFPSFPRCVGVYTNTYSAQVQYVRKFFQPQKLSRQNFGHHLYITQLDGNNNNIDDNKKQKYITVRLDSD